MTSNNSLKINIIAFSFFTLFVNIYLSPSLYANPVSEDFIKIADNDVIHDNIILKLVQDKQGFIWIGTPGGVLRYDGYQFRRYESVKDDITTISGNFIRDILVMNNGNLAVMSEYGGLSIINTETEKITRFNTLPAANKYKDKQTFRPIAQTSDSALWTGGLDGLLKISKDFTHTQLYHHTVDNLPIGNIKSLLVVGEYLYLGSELGLFIFNPMQETIEKVSLPTGKGQSSWISSLMQTSDGTIWAGGNPDIFYLPQGEHTFKRIISPDDRTDSHSPISPINAMLQINDAKIWVTQFDKVHIIDIETYEITSTLIPNQTKGFGLEMNEVRALLKDNAGQIWLGGYGGGLQRYLGQTAVSSLRAETQNTMFRLSNPSISAIFELKNGHLLFGSKGGGIDVYQPEVGIINRVKPDVNKPNMLKTGYIRTIAEQAGGRIWVGESPSYLFYSDDNFTSFTQVNDQQGYWGAKLRRMLVDTKDRLWIATEEGVALWKEKEQQFKRLKVHQTSKTLAGSINALFEDNQQRIWLGTNSQGLLIADPLTGDVHGVSLTKQSIEMPKNILGILIDTNDTLWFDTPQGLHFIRDLSANIFNIERAVVKSEINYNDFGANLLQDKHGRIWSHRHVYDPKNHSLYRLTASDGVQIGTGWFRSYIQTKSGQLYFGGSTGVVSIWPDKLRQWDYKPKVVATDIRIDNIRQPAQVAVNNQLILQPNNRSFSIEFSSLDLSEPSKNKYRYKLVGFDNTWQDTDANKRSVTYTNLWPGKYDFFVQGTNRMGMFSPHSTHIKITIKPKIWQTLWFLLSIVLLVFYFIYLLVQYRTRRIKRNAKILKNMVNIKTAELKTSQRKLLEEEKMSALGVMVMGIAHEMNTPIGVGITSISCLEDELTELQEKINVKKLTSQHLNGFILMACTSIRLVKSNLDKTAKLVQLFKQLSTQDETYPITSIDFKQWLPIQLTSFEKRLSKVNLVVEMPSRTKMNIKALALSSILSELLSNIFIHASNESEKLNISIILEFFDEKAKLIVSDDGKGINKQDYNTVFNPFVTSKRGSNCKGLGLYLCYNLATKVLNGDIRLNTKIQSKTQIEVIFPVKLT